MKDLLQKELLVQNRVYNLTKYTILFFSFCIISTTTINSADSIQKFGTVFTVIYIPLLFLGLTSNILKPDSDDGSLEFLLATTSSLKIILAKFIILIFNTIICFALILPVLFILFNLSLYNLVILLLTASLLITLSAALIVLIASIQAYFKANTNFLAILVMPLIIPNIILSGILLQSSLELYLLAIMFGINLVLVPPALYLSSHLIDNIYNI